MPQIVKTAAMLACDEVEHRGNLMCLHALVEHKADLNIQTNTHSALYYAIAGADESNKA
jgi:hypothetical protein